MCQMCFFVPPSGDCMFRRPEPGTPVATVEEVTDSTSSAVTLLAVGSDFLGTVASSSDRDYFTVALEAGKTYGFWLETRGEGEWDPDLFLYSAGFVDERSFDNGPGLNSYLTFTPGADTTVNLLVEGYLSSGDYTLSIRELPQKPFASVDDLADYLTHGYWEDTDRTWHAFDVSSDRIITVNLAGLTAEGQQLANWAMEAWEYVTGLEFQSITDGTADITFDDEDLYSAYASYVASGNTTVSSFVNVGQGWLEIYGTSLGSYSFQTYIHEIGHALGLGHQGFYNFTGTFANQALVANDSWSMSIMSYWNQDVNPNDPGTFAYLLTPMIADIVAIQSLYGAPRNGVTAGNTVWGEGTTLTGYLGDWFRQVFDGTPDMAQFAFTLYDQGGYDRVRFTTDTTDQIVNLAPESRWSVLGGTGNVFVARGTVIEAYEAGTGNDSVVGNHVNNALTGNAGQDTLYGEGANDVLRGGAGDDLLFGGSGADLLEGGDGADIGSGGTGSDRLFGGNAADTLHGNEGQDRLFGGSGADRLFGGADADTLTGGGDGDTLYGGNGDDRLDGGDFLDFLYGDAGADRLFGGAGDDRLYGGDDADSLFGGAGIDTVFGGQGANHLSGGAGNDDVYGGGDDDRMFGDIGNDWLEGNAGNDTISGGAGADTIYGMDDNDFLMGLGGNDWVYGGAGDDLIWAGDGDDNAGGGSGNDTVTGGGGHDRLDGEDGDDLLIGGDGDDVYAGGAGSDTFRFTAGHDQILDFTLGEDWIQISSVTGVFDWDTLTLVGYSDTDFVWHEFELSPNHTLRVYGVSDVESLRDYVLFVP